MVTLDSGAEHELEDVLLTRYACYLVTQNSYSRKEQIVFAQTYFALQSRKIELIEQRLKEMERVQARHKLQETEKSLSGILYERGINERGFALIRSKGDQALFCLSTSQLKRKIGAPESRPLADFLPTINIKAKDMAAEMTKVNIESKDLHGNYHIENEHIQNNTTVRHMLIQRGIYPEDLPGEEDVKKVERRLKSQNKKAAQTGGKKTKK